MNPEKRNSEKRLIMHYQSWPCYPVLPVVNRSDDGRGPGGMPGCGIIVAGDVGNQVGTIKVYDKNMWDLGTGPLKPQLEGVSFKEFENVDALLRAAREWSISNERESR